MADKENIELVFDPPPDFKLSDNTNSSPTRRPLGRINMESPFRQNTADAAPSLTPKKGGSSRVIEALHSEIDELKSELIQARSRSEELKKTNDVIKKRRDQLVEQISNVKHENDTVNALLERKQRRIADLENQLNGYMSSTDDLNFRVKALESRCLKLQESEMVAVAENERTKIAYDTIISSQKQYREHYTKEVTELREKLQEFLTTKDAEITRNIGMINKSDATIFRSIKFITINAEKVQSLYQKKNEALNTTIKDLHTRVLNNSNDTDALLSASKSLFFQIADQLQIDRTELMQKYLSSSEDQRNPFNDITEPNNFDDRAGDMSSNHLEPDAETEDTHESTEAPVKEPSGKSTLDTSTAVGHNNIALSVKKRGERQGSAGRSVSEQSTEERITSLCKDLNNSIPFTDREAKIDPPSKVTRNKSVRKTTNTSRANSGTDSRRSSKIYDRSASHNNSRVSSNAERTHSRKPSVIDHTPSLHVDQSSLRGDGETDGKKKRRRRRRRRNNNGGDHKEDTGDDGENSGEESS